MKSSWFILTIGLVLAALSVVTGVMAPMFFPNGWLLFVLVMGPISFAGWEGNRRRFNSYRLEDPTFAPTWFRTVIGLVALIGLGYWFNQVTHHAPMFRYQHGSPVGALIFIPTTCAVAFLYCFYYSLKSTANRRPRSHVSVG